MTILETILAGALFVALCGIALMRSHIRTLGTLLDQRTADHDQVLAENRTLRADYLTTLTDTTARVTAMTEDLRS